jgi:hypothetical protein
LSLPLSLLLLMLLPSSIVVACGGCVGCGSCIT